MAKRKKKQQTSRMVSLIATILGIVAIAMIFLPNVAVKDFDATYTGLNIVFGYTEKTVLGTIEVFRFSFMNLLVYLLAAAGIVFAVMGLNGGKLSNFISAGAFIACGILFFILPSFCLVNESATKFVSWIGGDITEALELAYGAIIGAIAALLAGLAQLYKVFVK